MKNNKGITLTTLIITIVVMTILSGITITGGYNVIKKAKLESIKTNMLLLQAQTKTVLEEYNFSKDETKLIGTKISDSDTNIVQKLNDAGVNSIDDWYYLQNEDYQEMNLSDVKPEENEYFLVKYDKENLEVEILYTKGYNNKYTLTELKNME